VGPADRVDGQVGPELLNPLRDAGDEDAPPWALLARDVDAADAGQVFGLQEPGRGAAGEAERGETLEPQRPAVRFPLDEGVGVGGDRLGAQKAVEREGNADRLEETQIARPGDPLPVEQLPAVRAAVKEADPAARAVADTQADEEAFIQAEVFGQFLNGDGAG